MPLCCSTDQVRYLTFKNSMKCFSSKTLTTRLRDLEKNRILNRQYFTEIPPRVEYRLTNRGQDLIGSIINFL